MNKIKDCENCGKSFSYSSSRRPNARFCSKPCLSKKTKEEQDEKRRIEWENETYEEYIKAMEIKFNKFAIKNDGCWDWSGSKNKQGYGVMLHRHKYIKSHRASYMIYKGQIPPKIFILHSCDNTSCCNPEHLSLGNQSENMQDMANKGRTKVIFGESNKASVLTSEKVKKIKDLLRVGVSCAKISKGFGVNANTIYSIRDGKTWKHVEGE